MVYCVSEQKSIPYIFKEINILNSDNNDRIPIQWMVKMVNNKSYDTNGGNDMIRDIYHALQYVWTVPLPLPLAEEF